MRKPHEFRDDGELIATLKDRRKELADWFAPDSRKRSEILRTAVGANTYRAFRKVNPPPSEVFRSWASDYLDSDRRIRILRNIQSQLDYDEWHEDLCRSLRRRWRYVTGEEMGFGPSTKLPNLVMKLLARWDGFAPVECQRLIQFLHVPLDIYTLVGLRYSFPSRALPQVMTMGFVEDQFTYWCMQAKIREITGKARVPPIYYDVLAWNMRH